MVFKENISLVNYSTMRLGGNARYLTHIKNQQELISAVNFAKDKRIPCLMIGSGSNIVWRDEGYQGLIIVNNIKGLDFNWQNQHQCLVTIASGEVWDNVVAETVKKDLSGIEALSLIPGTAGATPVQNVGAYGQEISDSINELKAYDLKNHKMVVINKADCLFGYRTSRFKTIDKGRFFITSLTIELSKTNLKPPFYKSLNIYLEKNNITSYTPRTIRDAVIDIRRHKLPDPKFVKNNGSFFANPIISKAEFLKLSLNYDNIPNWPVNNKQIKISAAWLIEQAGFSNYYDQQTGMSTWANQPLVLVNKQASHTRDLIKFRDKIINKIKQDFDITLIQEPELLP